MSGLAFIARSEIGKAIAHAIRLGAGSGSADADELRGEVAEMRAELERVRQELTETQERLDFAERLLARAQAPERLPRG